MERSVKKSFLLRSREGSRLFRDPGHRTTALGRQDAHLLPAIQKFLAALEANEVSVKVGLSPGRFRTSERDGEGCVPMGAAQKELPNRLKHRRNPWLSIGACLCHPEENTRTLEWPKLARLRQPSACFPAE